MLQTDLGLCRTPKTFLLAHRNFADHSYFYSFSNSVQIICIEHCGSSIGCIFYFTTYSSKRIYLEEKKNLSQNFIRKEDLVK